MHWCECLSKVRIGIQIVVLSLVSILDYMSCGFGGGEGAASKSMYHVILNNQIFFTKKRLQLKMKFLYLTLFLLRSHVPRASPTNSLKDKRWEWIEKIFKIIRRVKINNTYQKNSNVKFWYFENWDYWILSIVEILSFKEQVKPHAFSSFTTWLWNKWTVHISRFLNAYN